MDSMNRPVDDELLSAWLDGELDAAARERVDAWLREHPEDAARVRLWAADRDALRARFGPVAEEPLPPALAQAVWRRGGERWRAVALAAGVFAAGVLTGAVALQAWRHAEGD